MFSHQHIQQPYSGYIFVKPSSSVSTRPKFDIILSRDSYLYSGNRHTCVAVEGYLWNSPQSLVRTGGASHHKHFNNAKRHPPRYSSQLMLQLPFIEI